MGSSWAPDRDCIRYRGQGLTRLGLSARALGRGRRVARTLADLAGRERIEVADLAEAVQLRALDLSAGR